MQGRCLCGLVRYTADTKTLTTFVCHCLDCQWWTGSAFGIFSAIRDTAFRITGPVKSYSGKAESGRSITRHFCEACGSSIYTSLEKAPGIVVLSTGTLEGGAELLPERHTWVKRKHAWLKLEDAVRQFQEEMP